MSSRLHDMALSILASSWLLPDRLRPALLRRFGVAVDPGVAVCSGVRFISHDVAIGTDSFINYDCLIDSSGAPVRIGARVDIAPRVTITTWTHEAGAARRRAGAQRALPVTIEDGSWIGLGVAVLPGVRIGAGCVIAAGAVVTGDCAAHAMYAGIPARRVRGLDLVDAGQELAASARGD